MTPAAFKNNWKRSELNTFDLFSPSADGLSAASTEALKEYGLPSEAEPWLSFGESDPADGKEFYPIGHLANGSQVCIEKATDRIVIIDRDDPDDIWMLNSSLEALYESLVIFDAFIAEVNRRNPRYAANYRIPEGMLGELKDKLTACDPEAMKAKGYWFCELGMLDDSAL